MIAGARPVSATGLARLLERLDADREQAGEKYEALRRRLTALFEWRGSLRPEEHADETLDRLMRRLERGERVESIAAYAHGIARLVLLEAGREEERARRLRAELQHRGGVYAGGEAPLDADLRRQCLERCVRGLPAGDAELILAYYRDDGEGRAGSRRLLARRLGLAPNVLRGRVFRIRERLESCVQACLHGSADRAATRTRLYADVAPVAAAVRDADARGKGRVSAERTRVGGAGV